MILNKNIALNHHMAEFFPGQTPYQYAFNSPMTWRDPSGLAPEKEKKTARTHWCEVETNDIATGYFGPNIDMVEEAAEARSNYGTEKKAA